MKQFARYGCLEIDHLWPLAVKAGFHLRNVRGNCNKQAVHRFR